MRMVTNAKLMMVVLALLPLFSACTEDSGGNVSITSSSIVAMAAVERYNSTVDFHASASWTASCSADWLALAPAKGTAGNATLKLTTKQINRTKSQRTTQVIITAGGTRKTVTVIQHGDYAMFDKEEYVVGAGGGTLKLGFTVDMSDPSKLKIGFSKADWISWPDDSRQGPAASRASRDGSTVTRADVKGETHRLAVAPNTSADGRTCVLTLGYEDSSGEWLALDTAYIYQQGLTDDYESTDYSGDGIVDTLQEATQGRGVNLVLMGDGFADIDIKDSTYRRVMEQAMDNLFSEEPVRSLRHYFNVYMVSAVSLNRQVGTNRRTVFSCVPSRSTSDIGFDEDKVIEYTSKVDGINLESALSVVIVNASSHNGVTSLYYNTTTGSPRQWSVALCALIGGVQSETFRQVLVHEAIGHGLAKLADEYAYDTNGAITTTESSQLRWNHTFGWMLNVDTESDTKRILWSSFIGDSRFASENLGAYEGAYTFSAGVYRPSQESMMRGNDSPFNAPSRQAIYNKVMLLGEGRSDVSFDEFAAFDAEHKPTVWSYVTRGGASGEHRRQTPPVIKPWNR